MFSRWTPRALRFGHSFEQVVEAFAGGGLLSNSARRHVRAPARRALDASRTSPVLPRPCCGFSAHVA